MPEEKDNEVLIPEVLPPSREDARGRAAWREVPQEEPAARAGAGVFARIANFFGPIASGLVLDLCHRMPHTKPLMFLWLVLGFWFARVCNLRLKSCLLIALVSAFYPGPPGKFLPIATILGVFFAIRNGRKSGGS